MAEMFARMALAVEPYANQVGLQEGGDGHGDGDEHPVEEKGHPEEQEAQDAEHDAGGQVAFDGILVHVGRVL